MDEEDREAPSPQSQKTFLERNPAVCFVFSSLPAESRIVIQNEELHLF
jgi:hypothetical protein